MLIKGISNAHMRAGMKDRLTPACTGIMFFSLLFITIARAHPRMYGDYQKRGSISRHIIGSPPHVRGLCNAHMRAGMKDILFKKILKLFIFATAKYANSSCKRATLSGRTLPRNLRTTRPCDSGSHMGITA